MISLYRKISSAVDSYIGIAPLFIRLSVGYHLVQGVWGAVTNPEIMKAVVKFFESQNIIASSFIAPLTAYLEFICGILFMVGAFTRLAATIMVIVFINAILIVHIGDSYNSTFPALVMLSGSLLLFFTGAGLLSVDRAIRLD